VKSSIKEFVAEVASGCIPNSNNIGPVTIPAPIPKNPAAIPARIERNGYTIVLRFVHIIYPSVCTTPFCCSSSTRRRKINPNQITIPKTTGKLAKSNIQ